jgi:hypothetical protein
VSENIETVNWKVELRKIEREYDGKPAYTPIRSRTQIRLQKVQEIIARGKFEERLEVVGVWARLVLVAALATSLYWWPYGHTCGFPLAAFLVSQIMVIVGGVSVAGIAWRGRMLRVFAGSAFFIVAAWTVIALHMFPRIGYSTIPNAHATWTCMR